MQQKKNWLPRRPNTLILVLLLCCNASSDLENVTKYDHKLSVFIIYSGKYPTDDLCF